MSSARANRGRVSVIDGTARMIAFDDTQIRAILVEARGGEARELGRTAIDHGSRLVPERPVWNGTDVIVAGSTGFLGPLTLGAESVSWVTPPLGGAPLRIAAQVDTGITELVHRTLTGHVLRSFDRDGAARAPSEGVALALPDIWGAAAFGWLDGDGAGQPIVIAGVTRVADGSFLLVLQRFRPDGTTEAGFSAPIAWSGDIDLTTVPAPPHAHGYGVVAAPFPNHTLFHGAGQDFVGDASELPFSDCGAASIAAGPCGYVIACLTQGE